MKAELCVRSDDGRIQEIQSGHADEALRERQAGSKALRKGGSGWIKTRACLRVEVGEERVLANAVQERPPQLNQRRSCAKSK